MWWHWRCNEPVYSRGNEALAMIKDDPEQFDNIGKFNDSEDSMSNTNEDLRAAMWVLYGWCV